MGNYGLQKRAAVGLSQALETTATNLKNVGLIAAVGLGAGFLLKKVIDGIRNDFNKKRIIEDLALNHPVLKTVPKDTLMEWYASVCYYAPTLCTDKQTVAEVLQNFARFGKVDINTLKMLADTESKLSSVSRNEGTPGVTDILKLR